MDENKYRFVYKHFRPKNCWENFSDAETRELGVSKNLAIPLYHYQRGQSGWKPAVHGGLTACYVYNGDTVVATGEAECSIKDAFCYRIGREIARGRALKILEKENGK